MSQIAIINSAIQDVKQAYDNRVSVGCKSNLVWALESEDLFGIPGYGQSIFYYKVIRNPAGITTLNLYGMKYRQPPCNRDYGSNLVVSFDGNISSGSSVLALIAGSSVEGSVSNYITGVGSSESLIVKLNDIIVDDIDDPVYFNSGNLPRVVGFGSTQVIGIKTEVVGGISTGSNTVFKFGSGDFSMINIGDYIIAPTAGIDTVFNNIPLPPKVTGFGTGNYTLEYYNQSGILTTSQITVNTVILDKTATNGLEEGSFQVGILSASSAVFLSTVSTASTSFQNFLAYRFDSDIDEDAPKETASPSMPIKIGILNPNKLGIGSYIKLNNNGDPSDTRTWREYDYNKNGKKIKEPDVGAGSVNYDLGADQWPIVGRTDLYGLQVGPPTYAKEGDTLKIDENSPYGPTYTTIPPTTNCSQYDSAISSAEQKLASLDTNTAESIIKDAINSSSGLREKRNDKEIYAWSLLISSGKLRREINKLQKDITSLKSIDFSKFK
jgi:hypothetical protein